MEKSGKIFENCKADAENLGFYYTVDYCSMFVTFLAFHESKELSSFKILSPIW